ncbi:MAG: hypothetical protein ACJARG_001817 [Arcticibacterium sp.]|jgi:hypothetical protein
MMRFNTLGPMLPWMSPEKTTPIFESEIELSMVWIATNIKNRSHRKLVKKEVDKVYSIMGQYEPQFVKFLFSPLNDSYEDAYRVFLERFQEAAKWMNSHGKLKVVSVNEYYFEQLFKPKV